MDRLGCGDHLDNQKSLGGSVSKASAFRSGNDPGGPGSGPIPGSLLLPLVLYVCALSQKNK